MRAVETKLRYIATCHTQKKLPKHTVFFSYEIYLVKLIGTKT